jgi:DNA polymerase
MEMQFSPVILPEEPVPQDYAGCETCDLQRKRNRLIWGEGNPDAPLYVILDNPGAREDKEGNPFICGARQILQGAAYDAGIKLDDLYFTYVLKCKPTLRYDREAVIQTCMPHLEKQLQQKNPRLAFCLGNNAVRWSFKDMELDVKSLRGVWHNVRGLPTAVSYHPLAIRRRPNLRNIFAQDWTMVAERLSKEMA